MDDPINLPVFPAAIFSMLKGSKQAQNCKAVGLGTHSQEKVDVVQMWGCGSSQFWILIFFFFTSFSFPFPPECTYVSISWHVVPSAVAWSHIQGHLCSWL